MLRDTAIEGLGFRALGLGFGAEGVGFRAYGVIAV